MSRYGSKTRLLGTSRSSILGNWLNGHLTLSVQSGVIAMPATALTNTATITAVRTTQAVVLYGGVKYDTASTLDNALATVVLTNATTVTVTRGGSTGACTVSYTVIEFLPGTLRSLQSGTIVMAAVATNTATITAVNTARTFVLYQGSTNNAGGADDSLATVVLTNATTVTATRITANANCTAAYTVVEVA